MLIVEQNPIFAVFFNFLLYRIDNLYVKFMNTIDKIR